MTVNASAVLEGHEGNEKNGQGERQGTLSPETPTKGIKSLWNPFLPHGRGDLYVL